MKNLLILVHPHLEKSLYNKGITEGLQQLKLNITLRNLYQLYPDFKIDVAAEQTEILKYDRIIFQFPQYWYSTPALLKEWQDMVLTYDFAYGSGGNKLQGKRFLISTTLGMQKEDPAFPYLKELWYPLQFGAEYCNMIFETPIFSYGLEHHLPIEKVQQKIAEHIEKLSEFLKSNT